MIPDSTVIDPESPIPPEERRSARGVLLRGALIVVLLFALAAAWRWTSLRQWLDVKSIAGWEVSLRQSHAAPLYVLGAFVLGGLAVFPVTILIAATAFAFGPWTALFYSLLGCVLSAMAIYAIGFWLGRDTVARFTGRRWNRLHRLISKHGVLAVAVIRMLPVAPYSVVNLAAGAAHVRFRDFVLGTTIGMSPGVTGITLFETELEQMIHDPSGVTLAVLATILTFMILGAVWLRRWLGADSALPADDKPTLDKR
jgi:phospholipase D1/2